MRPKGDLEFLGSIRDLLVYRDQEGEIFHIGKDSFEKKD